MKTQKITGSQLRGMIKEALEESVVEIALDEQISALKVKGSKRTLKESKKYHKLLEAKIAFMKELASGGDSSGGDKPLTGAAGKIEDLFNKTGVAATTARAAKQAPAVKSQLVGDFVEDLKITPTNVPMVVASIKAAAAKVAEEKKGEINKPVEEVEGGLLGGTGSKPGAGDKI